MNTKDIKTLDELRVQLRTIERKFVQKALERNDFNLARTAADIGKSPTTLIGVIHTNDLDELYAKNSHGRGRPAVEK
jgi:hypothetical protein